MPLDDVQATLCWIESFFVGSQLWGLIAWGTLLYLYFTRTHFEIHLKAVVLTRVSRIFQIKQ